MVDQRDRLDGKVALITGGGQGVGHGIALALAARGAHVAVSGRTLSKCEATVERLEERGVEGLALSGNVKNADDLMAMLDTTIETFGRLDILVNNAQEVARGPLMSIDDEAFIGNFESGPLATFRLMKMAYPHLKDSQGHVINILSSVMKRWDVGTYGVYAAVKAATQQLTRAAANEWGKDGIRVNAILPHAKSPALAGWMERNPKEAAHFQSSIPQGRVGELEEDIGAFVALLCLESSRYITGQSIGVDGGQAFIG